MNRVVATAYLLVTLCAPILSVGDLPEETAKWVDLDVSEVREFLDALQAAVKEDDVEAVADLVHYPLRVNSETGTTYIESPQLFIEHYQTIMTDEIRQTVLEQKPYFALSTSEWIAFSGGKIWFGGLASVEVPDHYTVGIFAINQ